MATLKELVDEHGFGITVNVLRGPPFVVVREFESNTYICHSDKVGNFELNKTSCSDYNLVKE